MKILEEKASLKSFFDVLLAEAVHNFYSNNYIWQNVFMEKNEIFRKIFNKLLITGWNRYDVTIDCQRTAA